MKTYASSEKMKYGLKNCGFKIYRRCDEQARDILDEARSSITPILKGDETNEPLRTELVEKIIKIVATESILKKINRKAALLN